MGFFDFLDPVVNIVGGILGRNDAQEANQMSWDQMLHQNAFNARQAQKANKRNRQNMRLSDRLNDKNTRLAQRFQAREALKSRKATDRAAIRSRRWAQDDYDQQKADMADQFVRLRRAAKKGGFNPLTALGSAIIPNPAGGITSSSYAAASGVGAASVSAPGASQAMGGYGQPVAVPSLASNEAITGGVSELGRELSGEAAIERANAQLYHDIAKIELEQMKARIPQPIVPQSTQWMEKWGSGVGVKPVAVAPVAVQPKGWSLGGAGSVWRGEDALARQTGWETKVDPQRVGTNVDYLVRDGRATPVPKDDVEDWFAKELVRSVQDGVHKMVSVPGAVRDDFNRFKNYLVESAPSRTWVPRLGFDENNPYATQDRREYVNPLY